MQCYFACGVKGAPKHGDGYDQGFKEQSAQDPADDGYTSILLGLCGEELLIHDLVSEHE